MLQNLHRFEVAGHVQIDLVSHGGRWSTGEWIWTLCGTDLCTGWTELLPVMTKNQVRILPPAAVCWIALESRFQDREQPAPVGLDPAGPAEWTATSGS